MRIASVLSLCAVSLVAAAVGAQDAKQSAAGARPNIIVIVADDLGYGELGCYGGKEVRSTGDGVFATFEGPARAIACVDRTISAVAELGLDIRAGVHTGEVELLGGRVEGIAVHTGARIAAEARPCELLVSGIVRDLAAGSSIEFEDRGVRQLKGVPGEWQLFAARLSERAGIR